MPGYKRGSYKKSAKRALTRKYGAPKKVIPAVRTLQAAVRRLNVKMNKTIETKKSNYSITDGQEIFHNNFIKLDDNILQTSQGVTDPTTGPTNNRIGDQIALKGVSIKLLTELNERYSDVTFRLMVIKCAKGDDPTRTTLFNGLSANKIMDSINTERYSILFQKYFKIKSPNAVPIGNDGTTSEISVLAQGSGVYKEGGSQWSIRLSRATRMISVWIPGTRFTKSGIIQYENGSSQPKFFDYKVVLYAYSNYSTAQDIWYVGRVNEYMVQAYYKDA